MKGLKKIFANTVEFSFFARVAFVLFNAQNNFDLSIEKENSICGTRKYQVTKTVSSNEWKNDNSEHGIDKCRDGISH